VPTMMMPILAYAIVNQHSLTASEFEVVCLLSLTTRIFARSCCSLSAAALWHCADSTVLIWKGPAAWW
jgi:hypothetical protein